WRSFDQTRRGIKAQHEIQILNGLACCAFHKVIDGRNNNSSSSGCRDADMAIVAEHNAMNIRQSSFRANLDEWRIRVSCCQCRSRGCSFLMLEHDGAQNPTRDRNQVRREHKIFRKCLWETREHFRCVPVTQYAVRFQVLIDLAEVSFLFGMTSSARNSRFA